VRASFTARRTRPRRSRLSPDLERETWCRFWISAGRCSIESRRRRSRRAAACSRGYVPELAAVLPVAPSSVRSRTGGNEKRIGQRSPTSGCCFCRIDTSISQSDLSLSLNSICSSTRPLPPSRANGPTTGTPKEPAINRQKPPYVDRAKVRHDNLRVRADGTRLSAPSASATFRVDPRPGSSSPADKLQNETNRGLVPRARIKWEGSSPTPGDCVSIRIPSRLMPPAYYPSSSSLRAISFHFETGSSKEVESRRPSLAHDSSYEGRRLSPHEGTRRSCAPYSTTRRAARPS